ncbi:MAG: pilus assembly protein TadG-related protein [Chloroflexota bacterium]|nr:pilus assembly protein TadG-related protein [Chloroflexota bacterium]
MSKTSFAVRADNARREMVGRRQGQVVIMFALCLTVLLLLLGGALDFAGVTMEKGRLQNAADSAALAAAQTLDDGGDKPSASATATAFLSANGYPSTPPGNSIQIAYPTPSVGGVGNPQGIAQVADVSVGHPYQTPFWGLIGLPTVNLQVDAQASSSGRRFDIFLSIDESFSMSDSDMAQLQRAAHLFVQTLNPTTDQYSPKIAIAAFQGIRYTAEYSDMSTGKYTVAGLADSLILTHLTNKAQDLYHLIDGDPSNPGCPYFSISQDQPWMPYSVFPPTGIDKEGKKYGKDGVYTGGYDPNKQGIYVEGYAPAYTESTSQPPVPNPPFTQFACPLRQDKKGDTSGRFIRNAITAAFVPSVWDPFPIDSVRHPRGQQRDPLATWDAFSWQHGGRDGLQSDGTTRDPAPPAKRVLIVMTDGLNTIEPIPPGSRCTGLNPDGTSSEPQCGALNNQSFARYDPAHMQPANGAMTGTGTDADSVTVQAANAAKLGPDGSSAAGKTADDIEIYTIGFYGHNESGLTSASAPPMCPAPVLTAGMQSQMQRADKVLLGVSSSSPNSCDHYFPVDKSANQGLATIFASIAGRIKRAQLVN